MWLLILIVETFALIAILISAWNSFTSNPLITTLHDTLYPIKYVPFPAISLCNNNRISRSAATHYAEELARKDPEKRNVSYFLDQVVLLGKLYDFDYENLHQMTQFQEFLDVNDISNASGMYNAFDTLVKVSLLGWDDFSPIKMKQKIDSCFSSHPGAKTCCCDASGRASSFPA